MVACTLAAVLPFTLLACGDDDDDSTIDDIRDTVSDAADEAQSAVAGIAPVHVDIEEVGGSMVSGNAILTPEGSDSTRVSFEIDSEDYASVTATPANGEFEAGIWQGDCSAVSGSPAYDLNMVGDDASTEAVDVGIKELKDGDYVIALRDGDTVVACGAVE
jgi:hypothetical protein